MPALILFTFTLTVYRPGLLPVCCRRQFVCFPCAGLAAIWNTEFRSDTSTKVTFSLVTTLHVSCVS